METVTKTRVTASVNETKALSDKTEKGSLNVDTSATAAPMNMSKPNKTRVDNSKNLPLTPPEEKRSVSFDLLSNVLHLPCDKYCSDLYTYNGFATSPAESIDIAVRELPQDICVSLLKRHVEMKTVFARNQEFFNMVKQAIFEDEETWENFLQVLYSKRDDKPDEEWMNEISEFLSSNPPYFVTFKQIIGYYENENDDDNNDNNDSNSVTDSSNSTTHDDDDDDDNFDNFSDSCGMSEPGYIDITPIRNYPEKLENLELNYPQFFINAKELLCKENKERRRRGSALGGNHLGNDNPLLHPNADQPSEEEPSETPYEEFKRILTTPKSEMNDFEWETNIYECLDPFPQLIGQFEEMLIPEIPEITDSME